MVVGMGYVERSMVSAGGNIRWEGVVLGGLVALPAGLLLGPLLRGAYDTLTGFAVTTGS